MSRIAYVNGRYLPHGSAMVHIEDRGYQFADGVYEVCEVRGGRLIDERRHLQRLARSLGELHIAWPMEPAPLGVVLREVVRRNRVREGIVYAQVTRGVAPRDHAFPGVPPPSSLVVTAREIPLAPREARAAAGVAVITVPDNRWKRVDIKSVALLPNVLAKQKAHDAGAFEAWFVDAEGFVTEGSSTNAWIVTGDGVLVTHPPGYEILCGITRSVVVDLIAREGLSCEERRFSLGEAQGAREAFLTSASNGVTPIIRIDGKAVGTGRPGPLAARLRSIFDQVVEVAPLWSTPERG
jgi:D-alanine transaminase